MVNKSNWTNSQTPASASWSRAGGIDTNVPAYDDATLAYDDSATYYDGFNATTITTEDVKFDNWTNTQTPSNSTWIDIS